MQYYTNEQIGTLIKQIRKQRHITQKQLALATGLGLRFVSETENGKSSCEIDKVLRILQTLGVQVILIPPEQNR